MSAQVPVAEAARSTPLLAETEVLVLGGGPAGIAAAASAAAAGRDVLLVERYGFLGGMGTAAGVTNFCGLHANVHGEMRRVVHGVADELLERIDALGGLNAAACDLRPHAGPGLRRRRLQVRGRRTAAGAWRAAAVPCTARSAWRCAMAASVDALLVETRSGRRAIRAQVFVDASGDGDLLRLGRRAVGEGRRPGRDAVPDADVPRRRRRRRARRRGLARGRATHGRGAAQRPPPLRPAGRDPAADETCRRMARQRHADPQRAGPRDGRHRCAAAVGRRGRRPAPGARLLRLPARRDARLRERLPAGDRAAGGHPRDAPPASAVPCSTASDVLGCADFDDSIGVNAWPLEQHVAGDVRWSWPADATRAASTSCRGACCCRSACTTCWWPAAARR